MQSLSHSQLRDDVISDIIETCAVKGTMIKANCNPDQCEYVHTPISIFPTPYPYEHYQQALNLQPHLAAMVAELVRQPTHIHDILKYFQEQDPFLKRLVEMSKAYNSQAFK